MYYLFTGVSRTAYFACTQRPSLRYRMNNNNIILSIVRIPNNNIGNNDIVSKTESYNAFNSIIYIILYVILCKRMPIARFITNL